MLQQVDQVFLASRFGEFANLRSALTNSINANRQPKLKVINLDDGAVTAFPPLKECILHVKNSSFFILLLGDQYGSIPNGNEKSYTHLEYEEAYKNELETRILVFCIGDSYLENRIHYSDNPTMSQWQRDIEDRHTIGFFPKPTSKEESEQLAEKITYQLLNTVYDRYFGQVQFDDEFSPDDADVDENDIFGEENEIDKLENLDRSKSSDVQTSERSSKEEDLFNYLTIIGPSKEAKEALEMGEKSIAVKLFERIIDNRPLDILSNYWLAKLYLSVGGKKYLKKSVELSKRAAKASTLEGGNIRTSSAYQIASKASAELGNFEEARLYADSSIENAKNYAKAYVQKARVLIMENPKNRDDVKTLLENAINIHSGIISELFNDPLFKRHRDLIKVLFEKFLQKRINKLVSVIEIENKLIAIAAIDQYIPRTIPISAKSYYDILTESLLNQLSILKQLGKLYIDSLVDLGKDPYETIQIPKSVEAKKYFPENTKINQWYVQVGNIVKAEDILFKYYRTSDNKLTTYRWLDSYPICISEINHDDYIVNGDLLFKYVLPSNRSGRIDLEKELTNIKLNLDNVTSELDSIIKSRNNTYKLARLSLLAILIAGIVFGIINLKDNLFLGITSILGTFFLSAKGLDFIRSKWQTDRLQELKTRKPLLSEQFNTANDLYHSKKTKSDQIKMQLLECSQIFENNLFAIPSKIRSKFNIKSIDDNLYAGDYLVIKNETSLTEQYEIQKSIIFDENLRKNSLYKVVAHDRKIGIITLSKDLSYFEFDKPQ